jgi:hypothetical protein
VAVSAVAVWTPGGVFLNAPPVAGLTGGTLGPWPEAPVLTVVHPRARRPHREATVLVQLAHALLSLRTSFGIAPPCSRSQTDCLLGTSRGSEAADLDFLRDLRERGSGFGSPSTFVYTLSTAAPAEVAIALGLRASLATVSAGSVSGLSAIVRAAAHVSRGDAAACITGGVELGSTGAVEGDESRSEVAALFLLEPSSEGTDWPTLAAAQLGFEPVATASAVRDADSAMSTLVGLASACVGRKETSPIQIEGHSAEGHWARLCVQW